MASLPPRSHRGGSPTRGVHGDTWEMSGGVVDTVIFDLGGVIMRNGGPRDFTRRYPDHDPAVVAEIVMGPHHLDTDHQWHRVERGEITLAECREITKRMLDEAGIVASVPPVRPAEGGPAFTFALNDEMVRLVHDLRDAGRRIGILTNNVREFRQWWWPLMDFEQVFHTIVDSHEVGMRKPNPAIYELTMSRLGAEPGRTAFLDDLEANVHAARALGMHGIHVDEDATAAIAEARRIALD